MLAVTPASPAPWPAALDSLCHGVRPGLDQVLRQAEFAVGDHRKPHQFER